MVVNRTSKLPDYYIAVFGDPVGPPTKDRVEDGRYIPDQNHWPSGIIAGDLMLIYCTESYLGREKEIPGIAIVISADKSNNAIYYRYLPLEQPVTLDDINKCLLPIDKAKFDNRRFSTFWIFKIDRTSFSCVIKGHDINWP